MIDRDEVRDQIAHAMGWTTGHFGDVLDAVMAVVDPIVAERDDYRANGKEAAKVAFGVSEKLATVEAELAETHAAHRAALLGVSRPGQPTYEALEEHVAGLVQENGVLRGELDEAQRSANFWQSQAETWEREHQNTVLPYTSQLEDERDRLRLAWLSARRRAYGWCAAAETVIPRWDEDEVVKRFGFHAPNRCGKCGEEHPLVAELRESRFRWAEEAARLQAEVDRAFVFPHDWQEQIATEGTSCCGDSEAVIELLTNWRVDQFRKDAQKEPSDAQ